MSNSITGSVLGAALSKAARKQALIQAKKGKNEEQKKVIDFFAYSKKGCINFGPKIMSIDEYVSRIQAKVRALNLRERAIEMLGVDSSEVEGLIDPICLYNFNLDLDDNDIWFKLEDDKIVSSKYDVTWLFFSQTQVYVYTCEFDMTSDDFIENTKEYFYQDITCFEVQSEVVEKIDISAAQGCLGCLGGCFGGCINIGETIKKNNYTVDMFKITVAGSKCKVAMKNAGLQKQSISAARALLRERKLLK